MQLRPGKSSSGYSLYEDHDGNIWMRPWGKGVCFTERKISALHFTESDGLANNSVLSVIGDGEFIWIATLGRSVSRCNLLE